jgi:hypothetical protein
VEGLAGYFECGEDERGGHRRTRGEVGKLVVARGIVIAARDCSCAHTLIHYCTLYISRGCTLSTPDGPRESRRYLLL